jgi:DNA (cytosine-5)-methyltransferase 1
MAGGDEMKYATVCSGIGAPEAAWADMWGPPVFTSEIDKFPSAVLKHHYPDVPNYGDMTKYKEWPDHELNVLVGGTPCQAFSVAGLRRSLEDDRGNLTLTFLGIVRRYRPRFTIWENVPGVLNTRDNAFGHLLGGIVGAHQAPSPNGGKGGGWGNAGFILGPERVAAWRVLDAQYFGVPQRRKRVFLIASPREMGFAPCQILFEPESLRGNPPKGGKAGEEVAGGSAIGIDEECNASIEKYGPLLRGGQGGTRQACMVMAHGQGNAEICGDGSPSLTCNHEAPIVFENHGQDSRIKQVDKSPAISAKAGTGGKPGQGLPCVAIQDGRGMEKGQNGIGINEGGPAYTLDQTGAQAVAIHPHAIGRKDEAGPQAKPYRTDGKAYTHDSRGVSQAVANDTIVRRLTPMECERLQGFPDGYTLIPGKYKRIRDFHEAIVIFLVNHFGMTLEEAHHMAGHPDGKRYKALGNSMAVPVVRWIGQRINLYESLKKT